MGASGYFLSHLLVKYRECGPVGTPSENNEYYVLNSDIIKNVHAYALAGEPHHRDKNKIGDVAYAGKKISWVNVGSSDLNYKLLVLARIKHGTFINSSARHVMERAIKNLDIYRETMLKIKCQTQLFELDYDRFFLDTEYTHISEWCRFNDFEISDAMVSEIADYTQRNRTLLEKHNVQL